MSGALEFVGVVAEIVEAVLEVAPKKDSTEAPPPPDPAWEERKQEAIDHFRDNPWPDEGPTGDTGGLRAQVPRA
jgi:hypothetical protein